MSSDSSSSSFTSVRGDLLNEIVPVKCNKHLLKLITPLTRGIPASPVPSLQPPWHPLPLRLCRWLCLALEWAVSGLLLMVVQRKRSTSKGEVKARERRSKDRGKRASRERAGKLVTQMSRAVRGKQQLRDALFVFASIRCDVRPLGTLPTDYHPSIDYIVSAHRMRPTQGPHQIPSNETQFKAPQGNLLADFLQPYRATKVRVNWPGFGTSKGLWNSLQ